MRIAGHAKPGHQIELRRWGLAEAMGRRGGEGEDTGHAIR
jgi:hypothetical protein